MGRPRKIQVETENDVKSSLISFPVDVKDPTSIASRVLQAYDQEQLDRFLSGGWVLSTEEE